MSANDKAAAAWNDYVYTDQETEIEKLQERIKQLEAGDAALNYSIGLDLQKENDALKQRINRLEELGHELRECASMIGTHYSNQIETIDQAEAAVEAWDKETKETKQ